MEEFLHALGPVARSVLTVAAIAILALVANRVAFALLRRREQGEDDVSRNAMRRHLRAPASFTIPILAILLTWPLLEFSSDLATTLRRALVLATVVGCGWLVIGVINIVGDVIVARHRTEHADNLDERRVQTQVLVLRRIAVIVTFVLTVVLLLMSIPGAREIGVSLFASAGVAGLVIGLAARPTLSNIIAGIQIALTQPIRLDDVVIVEGEWGWIEEIRTTYVVVRVWDLRRLVVPLTHFIEKPFQNWTRTEADILGSVFVQVDYTVPVEEIRAELRRIAEASGYWDGKVCVLHVTDARERTLELRALMSAKDSPTTSTLSTSCGRCFSDL